MVELSSLPLHELAWMMEGDVVEHAGRDEGLGIELRFRISRSNKSTKLDRAEHTILDRVSTSVRYK